MHIEKEPHNQVSTNLKNYLNAIAHRDLGFFLPPFTQKMKSISISLPMFAEFKK